MDCRHGFQNYGAVTRQHFQLLLCYHIMKMLQGELHLFQESHKLLTNKQPGNANEFKDVVISLR
jgi:hypothetical protein